MAELELTDRVWSPIFGLNFRGTGEGVKIVVPPTYFGEHANSFD
jgi:hypothetical protein